MESTTCFTSTPLIPQVGLYTLGSCKAPGFRSLGAAPAALSPDMEYDKYRCFSGSAVELAGREAASHVLRQVREESGELQDCQVQCAAIGDSIDYEKVDANPVISAESLPEGGSHIDFRDPKLWREGRSTTPFVPLGKYGHALNDCKRAGMKKPGGVYSVGRSIPQSRKR